MLAVIGNPGRAIVIGNARQCSVCHLAEHIRQLRNDIFKVRDVFLVQHTGQAEIIVPGVVEYAGQMGNIVFARLTRLDTGNIFIAAAEGAVDDLDPGFLCVGVKRIFAEGLGNHTAPAVEADLFRCRQGMSCIRCGHPVGETGRPDQAEKRASAQVSIIIAFQ